MKNGVKNTQAAAYNNGRMVLLKCKASFFTCQRQSQFITAKMGPITMGAIKLGLHQIFKYILFICKDLTKPSKLRARSLEVTIN